MTQVRDTKMWYPEDATIKIYDYVYQEKASGTIPGSVFTIGSEAAAITGIDTNGSVLDQYVDASDNVQLRDALVELRKDGTETTYDSTTTGSIDFDASGSQLTFEANVTLATADDVLVSYSTAVKDKTNEVTDVAETGGGRPVEYTAVYGGTRIASKRLQEPFSVALTVLKSNLDFAAMVNGEAVTEVGSWGADTGSITGVKGADARSRKTLVIKDVDPETGNIMEFVYYNVLGVGKEVAGPADSNFTETVTFNCAPQDKNELYFKLYVDN